MLSGHAQLAEPAVDIHFADQKVASLGRPKVISSRRSGSEVWLVPVLVLMTIFGGLIVLTKGSVVAPFIYTLF